MPVDVRKHSIIKGMIHGDVAGTLTVGWSPTEIESIFGNGPVLNHRDWPSSIRGLPLMRRKTLTRFGLHSVQSQLFLLMCQHVPKHGLHLSAFEDAMVSALDANALRGVDQRLLFVAHSRRRSQVPDALARRRQRSRVCVPAAIFSALTRTSETESAGLAQSLSTAIYASPVNDMLTGALSAMIFRFLHEMDTQDFEYVLKPFLERVSEMISVEAYSGLRGILREDSSEFTDPGRIVSLLGKEHEHLSMVISALSVGLRWTTPPYQNAFEKVLRWGGDTDLLIALTGALMGARFGAEGVPEVAVADETIVERVVAALASPETGQGLAHEIELTHQSQVWREDIVAERRTR